MTKSKIEEYHIPFIKSLIFVAMVTIVSMASVRFLILRSYSPNISTPVYTSTQSQNSPD